MAKHDQTTGLFPVLMVWIEDQSWNVYVYCKLVNYYIDDDDEDY